MEQRRRSPTIHWTYGRFAVHGLSVGVSTGSVPTLIGTGGLGVTMAIMLAIFVGQD